MIAVASVVLYVMIGDRQHTVKNLNRVPCAFDQVNRLQIDGIESMTMVKNREGWSFEAPVREEVDRGAQGALNRFLGAKMFYDDVRDCREAPCERLKSDRPVHVVMSHDETPVCAFELGNGSKLGTYDAERRWIFIDDTAYRAFIPMMDFGPLLEQPIAGWRNRLALDVAMNDIESLDILSPNESYSLDKLGAKTEKNPQGWRVKSAQIEGKDIDVERFKIDEMRIATVIELITPFYVDDWVTTEEKTTMGEIVVHTTRGEQRIGIGRAIEGSAASWIGEGARFVHVGDRTGIISLQRLSGIFPSLNDMRSRRVWNPEIDQLATIELKTPEGCLRYQPKNRENWTSEKCDDGANKHDIPPENLGKLARALQYLEAYRFALPDEIADFQVQSTLTFSYGLENQPKYRLEMSPQTQGVSRFARILAFSEGGVVEAVPAFVLAENVAAILLESL